MALIGYGITTADMTEDQVAEAVKKEAEAFTRKEGLTATAVRLPPEWKQIGEIDGLKVVGHDYKTGRALVGVLV